MKVSSLFGTAVKESPADVDTANHELLVRAGYIRQLGAGIYTAMPLGLRALRRIEGILRDEMDGIGGQEITMPVVHPADVWKASGRWDQVGPEMVRLKDRKGADLALAMTHEEVVAWHALGEVRSWRQLPMLVYQIQTKFRDEPRARGGLVRVREFTMKDSYSLDRDEAGLQVQYDAHLAAYGRIFARCGLPVVVVRNDTGMMGGRVAHELMYVSSIGDDHLLLCDGCGYAANREVADYRVPADDGEARPYEKVATPGAATIAELAAFLGIEARQTAKVVLYWATRADPAVPDGLVMAVVRGDTEANDVAVGRAAGASALRAATTDEITAAGVVPGYASPIGADRSRVTVVVDALVEASPALVAGANDAGFHLLNTRCGRDYTPDHVGVVALAPEGALCAVCGATLRTARGVEVGNVFQLGTRYTDAVGATWLDEHGRAQPIVMGSYGIGVGRLLACVAEEHHDASGLCLPIAVAPFPVALVAMARKPGTQERADALYAELRSAGVEVLYDDRPKLSPGVKLAEADLRGMPLRVVVSDRGLAEGHVELKRRAGGEPWSVPVDAAVDAIRAELVSLRA